MLLWVMTMEKHKLIQSVQRAVDILNCFTPGRTSLTLAEISEATGLNVNTARGIIVTLVVNGLLLHDRKSGIYRLGYYFIGRAGIIQNEVDAYIKMFAPLVDEISEKYRVSASLQMVNMDDIFSIYCSYPRTAAYYIVLPAYSSLPKYATSSGKLLLLHNILKHDPNFGKNIEYISYTPYTLTDWPALSADLEAVRRKNFSQEMEEFALNVGSIAVPVLAPYSGELFFTISCTFFVKTINAMKEELLSSLRAAAAQATEMLQSGKGGNAS